MSILHDSGSRLIGASLIDVQGATLKFVAQQLYAKAAKHKNPKVQSETAAWLTRAGADFGIGLFEPKWAIATAKELLQHPNAAVRKEGVEFATLLHASLGAGFADSLRADLKPALMATVQESFDSAGPAATAPSRQERAAPKAAAATRAPSPAS